MKKPSNDQAVSSAVSYVAEAEDITIAHVYSPQLDIFKQEDKREPLVYWVSKFTKKAGSYLQGIREHVSLGPNLSKAVKGKVSLGARILQAGGVERFHRHAFSFSKGEKLLKASQCYLSTTAGPIAGMLFISTQKVSFHSERLLTLTSPEGEFARIPYKVSIPVERIKRASQSENSVKPNQKYIQIVTMDKFEFWFMGFVNCQRLFRCLQQIISAQQ